MPRSHIPLLRSTPNLGWSIDRPSMNPNQTPKFPKSNKFSNSPNTNPLWFTLITLPKLNPKLQQQLTTDKHTKNIQVRDYEEEGD